MNLIPEVVLKNGKSLSMTQATPEDAAAVIEFVNAIAGESDSLTFGKGVFLKTRSSWSIGRVCPLRDQSCENRKKIH